MQDPFFQLRRQVKEWLVENQCSQARLSRTLGFSEGLLSGFLTNDVGLSVANFVRLNAYTSAPWVNPNKGARIVQNTSMGASVPDVDLGDIETFENRHTETHLEQVRESGRNLRKGSTFEISQNNRKNFQNDTK